MPQTKYDLDTPITKEDGQALVKKTEDIQGVKFVNISTDGSAIVVTHGEDFDETAFKSTAGL